MDYFNQREVRISPDSPSNSLISPANSLLIDDDALNIEIARQDGFQTLHYNPDNSQSELSLTFQNFSSTRHKM